MNEPNKPDIYITTLRGSACKTYSGFIKEMGIAFSLPDSATNINDVSGYIFSSWLGYKKIKIVISNSGGLKKKTIRFNELMELLNEWKTFWESSDPQNEFIIEVS